MHEALIEAVRNRTLLYDTNNPDYMNFKLKDIIWNGIAKDLNLKDGAEAKEAWFKLRNCHRDALRRRRKYLKSGAAIETIKQWKFQKKMEFLIPCMVIRQHEDHVDDDSDYEELQEQPENTQIRTVKTENVETWNEEIEILQNDDIKIENSEHNEGNMNTIETVVKYTESPSISNVPSSEPKKKKIKNDDISSILKQSILRLEERAEERALERKKLKQPKAPNNDLYHFFMAMYKITKKMPPESQHLVRNDVFKVVSQMEAALLNITAYTESQ